MFLQLIIQTFKKYNSLIIKSCSIKNQLAILLELKQGVCAPRRCNVGSSRCMLCSELGLLSNSFMFFRRIGPLLTVLPGLKSTLLNYFRATEESHASRCRNSLAQLPSSDLCLPDPTQVLFPDLDPLVICYKTQKKETRKSSSSYLVNAYKTLSLESWSCSTGYF